MNRASHWGRASSLAVALLALAIVSEGSARAQYIVNPRAAMRAAAAHQKRAYRGNNAAYRGNNAAYRNTMGHQGNGQVISELRSIEMLLMQADHDYQGHRVKAMQEIGGAIRTLEPPAMRQAQGNPAAGYMPKRNGNGLNGGAGLGTGNGNSNGRKNRMPQATSDMHLRRALQALSTVENQLSSFGNNPHHARALVQVQKARQNLQVALNIR